MMTEEQQERVFRLLSRACVVLDQVKPNAPITQEIFEFLDGQGVLERSVPSGTTNDADDWRAVEVAHE